jgi:hypothetical protein
MKRNILFTLLAALVILGSTFGLVAQASAQEVTLYKNPQCGCCEGYAKYLRENGFKVTVKPTHELVAMSREAGLPDDFQGCHLSLIDGYFVSGHVPVATVNKLLTEQPPIKGITLPGMPQGSPGMSGVKREPFTTYSIGFGKPKVYAVD